MGIRIPASAGRRARRPSSSHSTDPQHEAAKRRPAPNGESKRASGPASSRNRKEFFTAADVAERWGMSERHVRRLIDDGELPAHCFGRAVRVALGDLLIYEASRIKDT